MQPAQLTDDQLDALAEAIAGRLPTGTHGDRVVLSRRQFAAAVGGTIGTAGLLGLGVDQATAQAAGSVGTAGDPVDVHAWDLNVANQMTSDLPMGGNDIAGVGSLSAGELNTDWLVDAGGHDTIQDAIDHAVNMGIYIVLVPGGNYSQNITVPEDVHLTGVSNRNVELSGQLTLDGVFSTASYLDIGGLDVEVGRLSVLKNCHGNPSMDITVVGDDATISKNDFNDGEIVWESGTSGGHGIGNKRVGSITDNGDNNWPTDLNS